MGISGILRVTDPPLDASPQVSPFLSPTPGLVSAPGVHAALMQGGHAACTHPLLQLRAMVGQKRREIWCEQGGDAANCRGGCRGDAANCKGGMLLTQGQAKHIPCKEAE